MMVLRMESTSHSFSLARGRTRMQMAGKTATCLAREEWLTVNSPSTPPACGEPPDPPECWGFYE